jgi:hypothetical protein
MFDNYVFTKDSCHNVEENGKIIGFEMQTLITYYRGIPLSMVYEVGISVDGIPVPREMLRISLDQVEWFTLAESETISTYKWEYSEPMYVRVLVDGGLRKGEHDIRMNLSVWPAYYPMPAGGERTRKVVIE